MLQFVTMLRRTFLQAASTAALVAASPVSYAAEGIRLGFDSFSIRAFEWKAIQMLDYAAGLKLDTVNLSSLGDYENLEPAYLQRGPARAASRPAPGSRNRQGWTNSPCRASNRRHNPTSESLSTRTH